jgi:hypothetical protein
MSAFVSTGYLPTMELHTDSLKAIISAPISADEAEILRDMYINAQKSSDSSIEQVKDVNARIRLIYLLATQQGKEAAKILLKYPIEDQKSTIFLAGICIESNGAAGRYVASMGISDEMALKELSRQSFVSILIALLGENHKKITSALKSPFITRRCNIDEGFVDDFFSAFLPNAKKGEDPLNLLGIFVKSHFKHSQEIGTALTLKIERIRSCPNPELSRKLTYWLGVAILILRQSDDEKIAAFIKLRLLDAFFDLRSPLMRIQLTKDLSKWLSLSLEEMNKSGGETSIPSLVQMECALLERAGVGASLLHQFKVSIPSPIKKDDRKLIRLIELLSCLNNRLTIDTQAKELILGKLIRPVGESGKKGGGFIEGKLPGQESWSSSYLSVVANFLTIFLYREEHNLKNYNFDERLIVKQLFVEKLKIPEDPRMLQKFHELLIDPPRLKNTFAVFTGKIASLPEKKPFEEVVRFIDVVIHDKFQEERANIDHNPHMAHLMEHYPEIFKKWMALHNWNFRVSEGGLVADFATSYMDFLCLSLDVVASCLALDGDPERTKALMEAILNPRNQYLKIGYPDKPITARVKLSIWISEIGPICLLHDPYDNGKEVHSRQLLEEMAIEVCRYLEIPLLTRGSKPYPWTKSKAFPYAIQSLGCEYAYEYVYECEKRVPFGKYAIADDLWIIPTGQPSM